MNIRRGGLLVSLLSVAACASAPPARPTTASNARNDDPWLHGPTCADVDPSQNAAGLRTEDLEMGIGAPVAEGQTVRVHYVASLPSGQVLHDSHDEGLPVEIIIGSTKTLCGFGRALAGMRAGGQRRAVIDSALAFGDGGRPPDVPPKTDLVFVIDLYLPADTMTSGGGPPPNPAAGMRRR
jgi:FKBP-type peptidyl-prolyl cis-trans isomerase